jgi:hypothetical protein
MRSLASLGMTVGRGELEEEEAGRRKNSIKFDMNYPARLFFLPLHIYTIVIPSETILRHEGLAKRGISFFITGLFLGDGFKVLTLLMAL